MDATLTKVSIKISAPSRKIITKTGGLVNLLLKEMFIDSEVLSFIITAITGG